METRNRITRRGFLGAVVASSVAVLAGACTSPAPAPTPEPGPTAASAATQAPLPAPKQVVHIEGYTFSAWQGYTGKERSEFIEEFTKEKGRPPEDDEIPTFNTREFWNRVSADFEEARPEYNVSWDTLDWANGRPKIDIRVAAGDPPDMVIWSGIDVGRFAAIDMLVDLKEVNDPYREELDPMFILTIKGVEYGMPISGSGTLWAINRALFRANGVEDLLPSEKTGWLWSHDTFLEACKAMTRGTGSEATYGVLFWADWPAFYPLSTSYGGPAWDPAGTAFILGDDERGVQGCQFMVDLVHKHQVTHPDSVSAAVATQTNDLFAQGRLGIRTSELYGYERALAENIKLGKLDPEKVETDIVLPPSDVKNGVKPQVYGPPNSANFACVFKAVGAERIQAAKAFLVFLGQPEYAAITYQYYQPFRPCQMTEEDENPERVRFREIRAVTHSDESNPSRWLHSAYWVACRPILNPMWEALLAQAEPIPQLLKEAKDEVAQFVQKDQRRLQF